MIIILMKEKIMNVWLNEKMNSCLQRELTKKLVKLGSEIRTLPDIEWSKIGQLWNGFNFLDATQSKPFEKRTNMSVF